MSDLPNQLRLEWKNLNYYVPLTQQSKNTFWQDCRTVEELHLLKNAYGHVKSGDLVAILGCSGAGKTTLLAAISQRLRGKVSGDVTLNGVALGRTEMTRISSFLPQCEISVKTFSAYEHLYFMSHFKMHRKTTTAEKRQRVGDLLYACGLQDVAHTRIKLLSGGERKRLGLAEELITDPPFLFCDEPTTGLDSYSAYRIIKTLRHICTNKTVAKTPMTSLYDEASTSNQNNIEMQLLHTIDYGFDPMDENSTLNKIKGNAIGSQKKAIICSVHQPSSDLFELFTHVILMDGGRIIFQGSSEQAMTLFTNLGYVLPRNCNPADFYLKTISDSHTQRTDGEIIRAKFEDEICGRYTGNWLLERDSGGYHLQRIKEFKKIRWLHQVYLLLFRLTIENSRDLKGNLIALGIFMIIPSVMAIVYSVNKTLSQSSIQDIDGSLFMITNQIIFSFTYGVATAHTDYQNTGMCTALPSALPIMRRDVGEGTYSLSAYYVAVFLSYIPGALFKSFLFFSVVYGCIYYARGFMLFLSMGFVLSISAIAATSYGLFISTLFESTTTTAECAGPIDLVLVLFGGAFYNVDSVPFFKYISMFFYSNEALFYKFWIDVDEIECPCNLGNACIQNGVEVLQRNSFRTYDYTYWTDCLGLLAVAVAFNLIAFSLVWKYVRRSGYY